MMRNNLFSLSVFFSLLLSGLFSFSQTKDELLAAQFMNDGEFDKAAVLYEKIYDKNPSETVYASWLKCLKSLKDFPKAEKLVKKHIKKNSDNLTLLVDLGSVYSASGDNAKAKQQYERAVRQLGPDQQAVIVLAEAFLVEREPDFAIMTYMKGRRMVGDLYPFNFELAEVYSHKQEYEKMLEEYLDVLNLNEGYIQSVQNTLQNKLASDPDNKKSELLRILLLKRVQRLPEKIIYAEMLIWMLEQQRDFESSFIQRKALDKRMKENGQRLLELGELCVSNESFDIAVKCYQYIIEKGKESPNNLYTLARMKLLEAKSEKISRSVIYTKEELLSLEKDYITTIDELGKSHGTASVIRGLARLQAFYLDKTDDAVKLLEETINLPGISRQLQAEYKLELADIFLMKGEIWEASLLYSQVEKSYKHDPLGQEAKFRNARLSYYNGDFEWAAAQLNVLKSATAQLMANDALSLALLITDNSGLDSTYDALSMYSRADLLLFQNKTDQAALTLDSLLKDFPGHSLSDDATYLKSKIMKRKGNYTGAAALLELIITAYRSDVLADDALFDLAELYEQKLNDSKKAMELYNNLLTKYPGSSYVSEARRRFRILRGDPIQN